MDSGFVETVGARLHYSIGGEGPAVVFIHAGVADSRMWLDQIGGLANAYTVAAFDQRGFGRTDFDPVPYADRDDVIAVMDHLGLDQAVLVGCSMGGDIALQTALQSPTRVIGLVLVGAAAPGWEPANGWNEPPQEDEAIAALRAGDIQRCVLLEAEVWLAGVGRTLGQIDPDLLATFIDMDTKPNLTYPDRAKLPIPFDGVVDERLDEIAVPCLVVVGEHDLPDVIESAGYLARRLSDQPEVVILGAAHLPSFEKPAEFNQVMRRFLATV
ncbi:MAG: alpha/beta hydrolase [Acidimicrobiia bacterium]